MGKTNKNFYKLVWATLALLCLGRNEVLGQSGRIKFEVRVDSIVAFEHGEPNLGGKNEYRYKFKINNTATLNLEINDVSKDDLPKLRKLTENNSIVRWEDYNDPFVISMEAWEEDCKGDNNYNSCDDVHCTDEYTVNYKTTEPGVWHKIREDGSTPFWCSMKYSAFVYFRWSPPKPPIPVVTPVSICKNEEVVQFEVPDHDQKQHVTEWQWQRGAIVQRQIHPTPSGCYEKCGGDSNCMNSCMAEEPEYKNEFSPRKYSYGSSDKFFYANNGEGYLVKYRQKYGDGVYSAWSDSIAETNSFRVATKPSSLETTVVDNAGNAISTNLICEDQTIKLVADVPDDKIASHTFHWYRNDIFMASTIGENEYIDTDNQIDKSTTITYSVKTQLADCPLTYSDSTNSARVFTFQGPVNSVEFEVIPTSCPGTEDGSITINSVTGGTDMVYYNIAKVGEDGKLDGFTDIKSSQKVPKNNPYPFNKLSAGNYKLQVINGGGSSLENFEGKNFEGSGYCFAEFPFTIDSTARMGIAADSRTNVSCHGGKTGSIDILLTKKKGDIQLKLQRTENSDYTNFQNVIEGEDYALLLNGSTLTISNLKWGYYQVSIDDIRSDTVVCAAIPEKLRFSITEPDELSISKTMKTYPLIPGDDYSFISCFDEEDGQVTIDASEGNENQSYYITLIKNNTDFINNSTFFNDTITISGLGPGHYDVAVTDCSGKISSDNFDIAEPEPLKIDSIEINPITCYGTANGEVNVFASGGTGKIKFRIDSDSNTAWVDERSEYEFVGLDSGRHTLEAKDINGCITTKLDFRLDYPTPLNFTDSLVMPLCHGGSDGKLLIWPSGGDPITQEYKVSIRHLDSLTSVMSTKVYSRAGDSLPLEFNKLPSGNYEVTVYDTDTETRHFDCNLVVDTVFLPQPTEVEVETVQVNMPSCAGASDGSVHIKAKGGTPGSNPDYYYSIDGIEYVAPNEQNIAVFTGLEAGNYTFYALDGHHDFYTEKDPPNGDGTIYSDPSVQLCTGSLSFTLDEPEVITVYTTMNPVTCYGTATGSIVVDSVSGGRSGYTYEWRMNGSDAPLSPDNPKILTNIGYGNYHLIVRDIVGCVGREDIIEVTQPNNPLAISSVIVYPESCSGTGDGTIRLSAEGGWGLSSYTYQINGGTERSTGYFEGLTAGIYTLTVRDRLGCEVSQTVELPADELVVEVDDQLPATIGFEDGLLRLNVSGGKNKKYYLDGNLSTTGAEFSGLATGEHTITIEFNNQCQWEQSYTIGEVAAPIPALRATTEALENVKCYGEQNGSIRVAVTGGVAPYQLQWNDPQHQTTAKATDLAKGNYTLSVTDAAETTLDYPVVIDGPELFEIANTVTVSPNCHQGTDGYAKVSVVGGVPPYIYTWSDPQKQTTDQADQLATGTYRVTITDQNGCSLSEELTIDPTSPLPDVLEPEAITLCTGQSIAIDAGDSWENFRWSSDNGFGSEARQVSINQAGRYFLEVISDRGCTAYDTLDLITKDNVIEAEFLLPTEIIVGDTVALTEVSWPAPEQSVWTYDDGVISHKSDGEKEYVIFPEPGEYTVSLVVMVGNCTDEVQKKIIVSNATAEAATENGRLGYVPESEFLLYPNPNHGRFTLKVAIQKMQDIRVSVYDPLFTYRYYQQAFSETKEIEEEIDLTHLKQGVYTLMVESAEEIKIIRFVIQ